MRRNRGRTKTTNNEIKTMNTIVMTVTPDQASKWLEINDNPRPISKRHVDNFSNKLRQGTFVLTHQGIAFDTNNKLRDGQHRLTAIVVTGISAKMTVTFGIEDISVKSIDRGMRRTTATVISSSQSVAAVTSLAANIMSPIQRASEADLIEMKKYIEPRLELIMGVTKTKKRGLTVASTWLGAVLNIDSDEVYVCNQYKYFVSGDVTLMSPIIASLWKRILESNRELRHEMLLAHSFVSFNPLKKEQKKSMIKNTADQLSEIRNILRNRNTINLEPKP